uniref:Neuronal PAS domain protein 1 n=1 Tax=Salmo trutta TaxID=8032 RepID=A0A673W2N0_SALTR
MPFVSEGKCVSVEWDFLQGLLAKPPTLPCLQNLRKEKSRNAARSRRGKENFEFFELAKMLPLPGAITSQLDKASVIRLTISYLHMRTFASQGDPPWCPLLEGENHCSKVRRSSHSLATDMFEQHLGAHLLQSLDGFVFVVSSEGRFLYISETVSIYLGLSQVELTGSSVFDYIHPADHVEMAERLGIRPHLRAEAGCHVAPESASSSASTSSLAGTPEPGFFIRMKSTLTKRGLHVKSSGYKVIHVTGRIRCRPAMVPGSARSVRRPMGLVALAHTLPPSTLNEVRMESQMFVFRVNMDLQVTYCENRYSYSDTQRHTTQNNTHQHSYTTTQQHSNTTTHNSITTQLHNDTTTHQHIHNTTTHQHSDTTTQQHNNTTTQLHTGADVCMGCICGCTVNNVMVVFDSIKKWYVFVCLCMCLYVYIMWIIPLLFPIGSQSTWT